MQTNKSQSSELESELELEAALSSEHSGQVSTSDQTAQLQGLSSNVPQSRTEGVPLPLLKLHVSPTSKIVTCYPWWLKVPKSPNLPIYLVSLL